MNNTIFKTAYAVGPIANSLYVNYGAYGDNFSILIKKGKFTNIFNLEDAGADPVSFLQTLYGALNSKQQLQFLTKCEPLEVLQELCGWDES